MGNREALLAGAKACLRSKGFARTTARDLAKASDVSLAAIGYHFGSKEALLTQALVEATGEWVEGLRQTLEGETRHQATPLERFEQVWTSLLNMFERDRQLWAMNFEISPYVEAMPEVREVLAEAQEAARHGLASLFLGQGNASDRAAGSFYYALLSGVMIQWLVDPQKAPSAADLTAALSHYRSASAS